MTLPAGQTENCVACLQRMTAEEKKYYEYRCAKCEEAWSARVFMWRHGKKDSELDALYGDEESQK